MTDSTSNSAVGHATPYDSNSELSMLQNVIRRMISQIDTAKIVKVTAVHPGTGNPPAQGTVDVLVLVSLVDGAGNATKQGIVYGLPFYRVGGGGNAIVCDPKVDDIGLAVVSDRDISSVKAAVAGGKDPQSTPGSFRQYSVSDGIYFGTVLRKGAPDQYLQFGDNLLKLADANGNTVVLDNTGITATDSAGNVIKTSADGIALTPASGKPVTVNGDLVVTGNLALGGSLTAVGGGTYAHPITTTGDVVAGTIALKTHTHTQPNDSHGDTEFPTSPPVP